MTENMKQFLEAVSKDEALTAKVGTLGKEELIALAKELGITLTEDDFAQSATELNDDELNVVAGGVEVNCNCVVGGGGSGDENDKTCVCVIAGVGMRDNGRERCVCPVSGFGYEYA